MIYIEPKEKVPLPKKYHEINNVCAFVYDQLTEILSDPIYKNLERGQFKIDKETQVFVKELESGEIHLLDWLKENNLQNELTDVLTRHLCLSILGDFLNFIYESLKCASSGKLSVAYALLRKPLTDELLLFEQFLQDKNEFIGRFYYNGNILEYDPSNSKVDKQGIIRGAISKLSTKLFFTEDLIYQLRYDKSVPGGINAVSNHALHIVTRDKHYPTSNKDLNFVFSQKADYDNRWEHYYFCVPYLLLYSVAVVDEIIFSFLPNKEHQVIREAKIFKRFIGFLIWNDKRNLSTREGNKKLLKNIQPLMSFKCHKCNKISKMTKLDYKLFFETELILCKSCFSNLSETEEAKEKISKLVSML